MPVIIQRCREKIMNGEKATRGTTNLGIFRYMLSKPQPSALYDTTQTIGSPSARCTSSLLTQHAQSSDRLCGPNTLHTLVATKPVEQYLALSLISSQLQNQPKNASGLTVTAPEQHVMSPPDAIYPPLLYTGFATRSFPVRASYSPSAPADRPVIR